MFDQEDFDKEYFVTTVTAVGDEGKRQAECACWSFANRIAWQATHDGWTAFVSKPMGEKIIAYCDHRFVTVECCKLVP